MSQKVQISKLDAARRQLEAAIDLYFASGDPLAVHTLAAAAYEILKGLAAARGEQMYLLATIEEQLPPELCKVVQGAMRTAQNFAKHADRDPEGVLEFNAGQTDFIMLDACCKLQELSASTSARMVTWFTWFMLQHDLPYKVSAEHRDELVRTRELARGTPRDEFYRDSMTVAARNARRQQA